MRLHPPRQLRRYLPRAELRRVAIRSATQDLIQGIFADLTPSLARLGALQSRPSCVTDIDKVIQGAILGQFQGTLALKTRYVAARHLFLIHRRGEGDHLASMFESLVSSAAQVGLQAEAYTFGAEPTMFFRPGAATGFVTLDDLGRMYENNRLIVVGESSLLFERASGRVHRWVSLFWSWHERAILTPTPQPRWGYDEAVLASEGFLVVPATATGIEALSREWSPADAARDDSLSAAGHGVTHADPRYPSLLEAESIHLVSAARPERAHLQALHEQLVEYLGPYMTWLAACAVYPQLHWHLTLRLGLGLASQRVIAQPSMDVCGLLVRLPWFRDGRMPDPVRSLLLAKLAPDVTRVVRATLESLFSEIVPDDASGAVLNLAVETPGSGQWRDRVRRFFTTRRDRP